MKWEYQTVVLGVAGLLGVSFDNDEAQTFTNEMGAQGWELVSVFSVNEGAGRSREIVFIFKRPLGE